MLIGLHDITSADPQRHVFGSVYFIMFQHQHNAIGRCRDKCRKVPEPFFPCLPGESINILCWIDRVYNFSSLICFAKVIAPRCHLHPHSYSAFRSETNFSSVQSASSLMRLLWSQLLQFLFYWQHRFRWRHHCPQDCSEMRGRESLWRVQRVLFWAGLYGWETSFPSKISMPQN